MGIGTIECVWFFSFCLFILVIMVLEFFSHQVDGFCKVQSFFIVQRYLTWMASFHVFKDFLNGTTGGGGHVGI